MKTLLILHGWGGSKQSWQEFLVLAQKNSLFKIDFLELPCFGSEPCPTSVWGVEEYAEFVKSYIKKQNYSVKDLIILGHSFGGQIATNLLANNSQICSKLILSGPAICRPKNLLKRAIFGMIGRGGKLLFALPGLSRLEKKARNILYRGADSPDYQKTNGIQRQIFQKVIRQDQLHNLSRITIPCLLLWGKSDRYVPYRHIKKIVSRLKQQTLVILPGTHGLHQKTKELFLKEIDSFIQQ